MVAEAKDNDHTLDNQERSNSAGADKYKHTRNYYCGNLNLTKPWVKDNYVFTGLIIFDKQGSVWILFQQISL